MRKNQQSVILLHNYTFPMLYQLCRLTITSIESIQINDKDIFIISNNSLLLNLSDLFKHTFISTEYIEKNESN